MKTRRQPMKIVAITIAIILFATNFANAISADDLNAAQQAKLEQLDFQAQEDALLNNTLNDLRFPPPRKQREQKDKPLREDTQRDLPPAPALND
jgi:hypothetical protein